MIKTFKISEFTRTKIFNSNLLNIFLLLIFVLLSRFLVLDGKYHGYGWDPGNFALAAEDYSLENARPHLPGYYLHIQIIKVFSAIFKNHFTSMIFLSVLYTCLSILFLYPMIRKWYNQLDTMLISLVILFNPFSWFYGLTSEIYAFDLFFSVIIVYFCLSPKLIFYSPIILTLGTGVRPTSGVLIAPLYIYLWYYHIKNNKISITKTIIFQSFGILGFFVWFIPMIHSAGGLYSYIRLYKTVNPASGITLPHNIFELLSYIMYILPTIFLFILGIYLSRADNYEGVNFSTKYSGSYFKVLYYWLIPSILCFLLFRYSKGYILLIMVALILFLTSLIRKSQVRQYTLISVIIIQMSIFLFLPYRTPHVQIYFKRYDRDLSLGKVWFDRTFSGFNLTKSKISALHECFFIIDSTIHTIEYKNSYILIDPTSIVSIRALQAQYPNIGFTKVFPLEDKLHYGIFKGINIENKNDIKQMLINSVIIGSTDLLDTYLTEVRAHYIVRGDRWCSFRISKPNVDQYLDFWSNGLLKK